MMAISEAPRELQAARAALAAEWQASMPPDPTPSMVAQFYRSSRMQAPDLEAWHATATRQAWTAELVKIAQEIQPARVVDIGCGLGHDLAALREALPAAVLVGVEPNVHQQARAACVAPPVSIVSAVDEAPIETADLLVCVDLLEHVPDPEAFLGAIAQRAPLGCYLFETTATHHVSNPLHLRENIGWRPQRVLDRYGWQLRGEGSGELRVRVWERTVLEAPPRAALLLCAYRNISVPTVRGMMALQAARVPAAAINHVTAHQDETPWRVSIRDGDGLITRSRALLLTEWWAETADDVALMVDDDICFGAQDARYAVELCRQTRSVVCGAYAVGDGSHFALRLWDDRGPDVIEFQPDAAPINIEYGATGFMAIHRDVVNAIMAVTAWVHEDAPWAFKPVFEVGSQPHGDVHLYVSEDWWFSQRIRDLGFEIWLDPRIRLGHLKTLPITVGNMGLVRELIANQ